MSYLADRDLDDENDFDLYRTIDRTPWPLLTGDEDATAYVDRIYRENADREYRP